MLQDVPRLAFDFKIALVKCLSSIKLVLQAILTKMAIVFLQKLGRCHAANYFAMNSVILIPIILAMGPFLLITLLYCYKPTSMKMKKLLVPFVAKQDSNPLLLSQSGLETRSWE